MIGAEKLGIGEMNARAEEAYMPDLEMVESIKTQGIFQPLIVTQSNKGEKKEFAIIVGRRRFFAGMDAGLKQFPCIIKKLTNFEALGLSIQENLQRDDLTAIQKADSIRKIWDMLPDKKYGEKIKLLKTVTGLGERLINSYVSISKMPDSVKEVASTAPGAVDYKVLEAIATKLKDVPEERQKEAIEIASQMGREQAKDFIEKVAENPDQPAQQTYQKEVLKEALSFDFSFNKSNYTKAFQKACIDKKKKYNLVARDYILDGLKREGYIYDF